MFKYKFAVLATILSFSAFAQKIAIIDTETIIESSKAMKSFSSQINKEKDKMQEKFQKQESELKEKENALIRESAMLSDEKKREKIMAFQKEISDFKMSVQREENRLKNDYMNAASKVLEKVKAILVDMNKNSDTKYDVVLPANGVVYYQDSVDITFDVLKRLNKEYKRIK